MAALFYLAGIGLAGYAGYSKLGWYFIFIASLVMAIGYFIMRAPQMDGMISEGGISTVPKLILIQVLALSMFAAPVYFIAKLLS